MKNTGIFLGTLMLLSITFSANAQQGFGTNNPHPSAVVDMVGSNKGALLPRVALTSTTDATTVSGPANALTVFNTATTSAGTDDVMPGYYYWSTADAKWIRILDGSFIPTNNGITKNAATNNIELGGNLNRATTITQNGNALAIATGGEDFIVSGLDKTKVQATVNGATTTGITDHLLAVGADNTVKALKATMPKFFFMPSIIIPTSQQQLDAANSGKVAGDAFDDATLAGTINLYGRYQAQFGTTGTATQPSSPGAPMLPVLPASELNYYVTWYDTTVFNSVTINASGVMAYEVDANADITAGSFMNIVFSVKED